MPQLKPWKKIGDPQVLARAFGKWFQVQTRENPLTGDPDDFASFGQKDWSIVLALTEDGQALVVRQFKHGVEEIMYELPAGTANFAEESPEQVMTRELREETGHEARQMVYLGSYTIASGSSPTRYHSFLALGCRKVGKAKLDRNEQIEWSAIPLPRLMEMFANREIYEGSSGTTVLRALQHLGFLPKEFRLPASL